MVFFEVAEIRAFKVVNAVVVPPNAVFWFLPVILQFTGPILTIFPLASFSACAGAVSIESSLRAGGLLPPKSVITATSTLAPLVLLSLGCVIAVTTHFHPLMTNEEPMMISPFSASDLVGVTFTPFFSWTFFGSPVGIATTASASPAILASSANSSELPSSAARSGSSSVGGSNASFEVSPVGATAVSRGSVSRVKWELKSETDVSAS